MDFLFYNRDILFEISKYLSRRDMICLKYAFPILDLENIYRQRDDLIKNRFAINYPPITPYYPQNIKSFFKTIFENKDDLFLLYNRTYDPIKRIIYADIDNEETSLIYRLKFEYHEFVDFIPIFGILLKIRNGHNWALDNIQYSPYYSDVLINDKYINYLINHDLLGNFINQNLIHLSEISNYFYYHDYLEKFYPFLGSDLIELIWNYLPDENQSMLIETIKKNIDYESDTYSSVRFLIDNYIGK